jgi:hypothetical protein
LSGLDLEQAKLNRHAVAGLSHAARKETIDTDLFPAIERNLIQRWWRGNGLVRITAYHVELAFEVEVLPQDLADGLGSRYGFRVTGERDELRHGDPGRQAWRPFDDESNLILLGRRLLCAGGQTERGAGDRGNDGESA